MILTKKIKIKISNPNVKHYRNKNYKCNSGDVIEVKVGDIPSASHQVIRISCDLCGSDRDLSVYNYWKNYNKYNIYTCHKCCSMKRKETCLFKYGVDHPMKLYKFSKKQRKTTLNRYGVEYYSQTEEFNIKVAETCLTRYGFTNYSMTDEFKLRFKESSLNNYGVVHPMKNLIVSNRVKKTNLIKYGVICAFQLDEFKLKYKETCIEKYGVVHPMQSIICKEKSKKTCLDKYGNAYYFKTEEFKIKSRETLMCIYGVDNIFKCVKIKQSIRTNMENKGFWSTNTSEFDKYRNKVNRLTNRIRKKFFDDWLGYDFYDNEYIKDNLNLCYSVGDYPTIDHKTSVLYGYINKISPEEIASIENLCITKRNINSSKGSKNSDEFTM